MSIQPQPNQPQKPKGIFPNPHGAATKLTPERIKKLTDYMLGGLHMEVACKAVSIDYATLRRWLLIGEQAAKDGVTDATMLHYQLYEALHKAEAEAEALVVMQWQALVATSPRAARDFIERRYPERWRQAQAIDITLTHAQQLSGTLDVVIQELDAGLSALVRKYPDIRQDVADLLKAIYRARLMDGSQEQQQVAQEQGSDTTVELLLNPPIDALDGEVRDVTTDLADDTSDFEPGADERE